MGRKGSLSGGGIESNKVVNTQNPKQEPRPHSVSVGATSRLGGMVGEGTPYKAIYNGQGYTTPYGATPSVQGPGGGRMVMKSGSQGQHGAAVSGTARPGANKPIFPGFK
jgi:hypothetical protein